MDVKRVKRKADEDVTMTDDTTEIPIVNKRVRYSTVSAVPQRAVARFARFSSNLTGFDAESVESCATAVVDEKKDEKKDYPATSTLDSRQPAVGTQIPKPIINRGHKRLNGTTTTTNNNADTPQKRIRPNHPSVRNHTNTEEELQELADAVVRCQDNVTYCSSGWNTAELLVELERAKHALVSAQLDNERHQRQRLALENQQLKDQLLRLMTPRIFDSGFAAAASESSRLLLATA